MSAVEGFFSLYSSPNTLPVEHSIATARLDAFSRLGRGTNTTADLHAGGTVGGPHSTGRRTHHHLPRNVVTKSNHLLIDPLIADLFSMAAGMRRHSRQYVATFRRYGLSGRVWSASSTHNWRSHVFKVEGMIRRRSVGMFRRAIITLCPCPRKSMT